MSTQRLQSMRTWRKALRPDQRGALAVEYVVITMVGLIVAAALAGLGAVLVEAFGSSLKVLYSEFP
jgi:Flp pilus assembly pilin Flp